MPKIPDSFFDPMKRIKRRMDEVEMARKVIVEYLGGPWRHGYSAAIGTINCPICRRKDCLSFHRAGSNGHIWARCSTPNCVSWIE